MTGMVVRIWAEGERPEMDEGSGIPRSRREVREEVLNGLPEHSFPAAACKGFTTEVREDHGGHQDPHPLAEDARRVGHPLDDFTLEMDPWEARERERERRVYRRRTVAMLRRYLRFSIETGRLPSVLGREFFRAKVTSYRVGTFEDRVIFVHDMETCLERLDEFSRQLIARHILQEHDQEATARLLHCTGRTVRTYVPIVLDMLGEILLELGLMERLDWGTRNCCEKPCQGGAGGENFVSDCEESENKSENLSG